MIPTSEERREVAQMLRIEVRDKDTSLDYPINRIINDVLGVNGAWGAKAARILADLIDPTCTSVLAKGKCSVCGEPLGSHANYCPKCGARVVDDE